MSRLDHWSHAGWVAIWCDTDLLRRLREHQADGESVHDVVRRLLLAGLDAIPVHSGPESTENS